MVTSETGHHLTEACGAAPDLTVLNNKERHFSQLQVIAAVGSDGQKCNLVFQETGERLNARTYIKYLRQHINLWACRTYGNSWWLQHEGASCHTTNACRNSLLPRLLVSLPRTSGRPTAQMQYPRTMRYLGMSRAYSVVSSTRQNTSGRLLPLTPAPSWTRPSSTTAARSSGPSWRTSLPTMGVGLSIN